jgi:3-oxoisoapionate decarboxylase
MLDKLGLSSYAYYWLCKAAPTPADAALALLRRTADLGLKVLQICDNAPLGELSEPELLDLRAQASRLSVTLEAGTRSLDQANLHTYLNICGTLGAKILRLVPWSGASTPQRLDPEVLRQRVQHILPLCQSLGVTLAVENYFDLPDEDLASVIRQINHPRLGVCLDTANSTGFLAPPLQTVQLLAPHCVSLHLKDFTVEKPVMGYRVAGVPLGEGWLNVPAVLNCIRATPLPANVLLELWVDPLDDPQATLAKEDD